VNFLYKEQGVEEKKEAETGKKIPMGKKKL